MTVAALLLAAGQSRRFGSQDKLLAGFEGLPLVVHAARVLSGIGLRLGVVSSVPVEGLLQGEGFTTRMIPPGDQSASIGAGVAELQKRGASRIVIALGDMALLRPDDIAALLALPPDQPASAWLEGAPSPPAVFPASWFPRLMALRGDRGAGALLRDPGQGARLAIPAARLRDIDTPEALSALTDSCAAGRQA